MLSNKRIIKELIRLRGCAGWSAPLLFANIEDRFSCVEAKIKHLLTLITIYLLEQVEFFYNLLFLQVNTSHSHINKIIQPIKPKMHGKQREAFDLDQHCL